MLASNLPAILYHYITKLLNCLYVKMKWNSVIVEQILHKFKKLPWWTFHLLLPGACSQLSFPLTWPQQLPYARLNTKRLKPKVLDHFSKRLAPNWSTKIKNYFPKKFSNSSILQLFGIPTSQAWQQEQSGGGTTVTSLHKKKDGSFVLQSTPEPSYDLSFLKISFGIQQMLPDYLCTFAPNKLVFPLISFAFELNPQHFYQTQVNLGSDLWVRMSVRPSLREVCKT